MRLLSNRITPLTALDVLRGICAAFKGQVGRDPSNSTLAILAAQSALETGRWKSCHWFNLTNIRPPSGWTGFYTQFRCSEQLSPGVWKWYDPPDPGSNFVAFETLEEGCAFYLMMLAKRWPEAWTAALNGNTTMFVHGLKQRGFFTADETPYRIAVQRLCTEFFDYMNRGLVGADASSLVPAYDPNMAAIHAAVAGATVIAPALLIGCEGEAVKRWQAVIGVPADGIFGAETESATKSWQLKHGLPVTGAACQPDLEAASLS